MSNYTCPGCSGDMELGNRVPDNQIVTCTDCGFREFQSVLDRRNRELLNFLEG